MRSIHRLIPAVLLVLLCVIILKASIPQVPTGTWADGNPLSVARTGATATLLPDGRVLIAGGQDASGNALASADLFNADGSVSAAPPMSTARYGHSAIFLMDGYVLVAGGHTSGGGVTNTAELFDPLTNTWQSLGVMSDPRADFTMSQLQDGDVLLVGGDNGSAPLSSIEKFVLTANSFQHAASLNAARKSHAAAALNDGRVIIAGGSGLDSSSNAVALNSTEIYDPTSNSVSAGPALNTARFAHTATTLIDGTVLLAGGNDGTNELASAEIYDPAAGTITASVSSLATPRSHHTALLLPNNNSVLIAGGTSAGADLKSTELYQSWNHAFIANTDMSVARANAVASPVATDGVALLAGGSQSSTELYGFATVKTDKSDYAPGETVNIIGSGWQPGETVALTIVESPNLDAHGPYTAVADAAGNIANSSFVPDTNDQGLRFYLTAVGVASQAQNTFTDNKTLTIAMTGAGSGTVTSSPGTISCASTSGTTSGTCSDNSFANSATVTLTATPIGSSTFAGWTVPTGAAGATSLSTGCTSAGLTCTFGMNNNNFTVTARFNPGPASQYTVTANNSSPVAGTAVTITAQLADSGGNPVATAGKVITWSKTGTGGSFGSPTSTTNASGVATVSFTTGTVAGTVYTVTATDDTLPTHLTGTSTTITTVAGSLTHFAISTIASPQIAGTAFNVTITALDSNNNTVTTFDGNGNRVNLTSTGTLTGSPISTPPFTLGLVTQGVTITNTGNFTITATGTGGNSGVNGISNAFDVNPGAANKLVFGQQPTTTNAGASITPAVTVRILDAFNNLATASSAPVAMAIGTNPSSGTLTGTTPVNAVNGVATFSNLSINKGGIGYTLVASSSGLTNTTSSAFTINDLSTTTSLASSLNPSTYGDSVTFTATVTNNSSTPTGAVTFIEGGTCAAPATILANSVTLNGTGKASFGTSTLSATSHTIVACYIPTGSFTGSQGSLVQVVNKKDATWTTTAASKTYGDADPNPLTTGSGTGFLVGDGVTATYSRAAGETVLGGAYHITATLSATVAGALSNYNITNAGADFTIGTKAASWTTNSGSKTYGDADPNPLTTGSGSGFLAADNITATYSRAAGETVLGGPYHITATLAPLAALSNYNITNTGASFTIIKRDASVTPNIASKTYGDADPAFTGTLTNFVAADSVTATYARTAGETVAGGPYSISATLGPAGVLGNYNITYNTANFTIIKRDASLTPNIASKTYGDADPAFSGTLTNFVAADGVTATYARTAGETVAGSPYTISATLSPAGVLGNYNITYNTAAFSILKRDASVTPNPASKTYGDADPAFTGTLTNFVGTDGVTATYNRTAGETVAGAPYTISATLSPVGVLGNYNITYNTANFTIIKRDASVTPNSASKTYGDADPTLIGTLTGFLDSDGVSATYSRTAGDTVAGSPYTISATLSPAGVLGNYNITYNTANFTINKRDASVAPNIASKTYGEVDPAFTGTITNFVTTDGVTATYARTAGETVAGSPYTISATLSPVGVLGNYNITYNTANFTINKRPASVTPNAANKTYGDPEPVLSGTLSGFVATDGVTATYSRTSGETVLGSPYTISAVLSPVAVLDNYSITYNTASFVINARPATWTTNPNSKTYGDADPTPVTTGSGSGFLVTDGVTATYSRAAGETVLGSPYHITATLAPAAVLSNYSITNTGASFTINKATLTVTTDNKSMLLNGPVPPLTGSISGVKFTDNLTVSYSTVGTGTVAGTFPILATVNDPDSKLVNYNLNLSNGTLTVTFVSSGMCLGEAGHQILQPINVDGMSVFKRGSVVPMKFRVCDYYGKSVGPTQLTPNLWIGTSSGAITDVNEAIYSNTPDSSFRWDPSAQQWIFNFSTKGASPSAATYWFEVHLNDGSSIPYHFGLR